MKATPEKVNEWSYPVKDVQLALQAVIVPSGLPLREATLPPLGLTTPTRWLMEAPRALGLESLVTEVKGDELHATLLRSEAMLVRIYGSGTDQFLSVIGGPVCRLFPPNNAPPIDVPALELSYAIFRSTAWDPTLAWLKELPNGSEILDTLSREGQLPFAKFSMTTFRPDATHSLWTQAKGDGIRGLLAQLVGVSVVRSFVSGGAVFALGSAALTGRVDTSRLIGWTLLLLTDLPLAYISGIVYGRCSIALGSAFKRRLLEGTFHLAPDDVRSKGLGRLLAQVSQAEVVEGAAITEVSNVVAAVGLWIASIALCLKAPSPYALLALLLVFTVVVGWLAVRRSALFIAQYNQRIVLTDDLVEKIIGHRTRLLQRTLASANAGEDEQLHAYATVARDFDNVSSWGGLSSRIWFVASLFVMLLAFFQKDPGVLYMALAVFAAQASWTAINSATNAWAPWYCAWRSIKPLFEAGRIQDRPWRPIPEMASTPGKRALTATISNLSFNHPGTGRPILRDVAIQVFEGERILLEGASGSGKSTFAALLAAERRPTAGTILVGGLDVDSVPKAEWRTRVAYAPQFHENYVFSNTFAFNLDPRANHGEVADEAREICEELGLGPLLRRMPSAYVQTLGETGWQLSHGEKSRLYIARTLLQGAELVIFDESFGALDPETVQLVMKCVRKRTRTLVVIAHP